MTVPGIGYSISPMRTLLLTILLLSACTTVTTTEEVAGYTFVPATANITVHTAEWSTGSVTLEGELVQLQISTSPMTG